MKITKFQSAVMATSALLLLHSVVANAGVCEDFRQQYALRLEQDKDINSIGAKRLCFSKCRKNEVLAEEFWQPDRLASAKEIRETLGEYAEWNAFVSEFDLNGDGVSDVRIARRVGTASCVRDTYLRHTSAGYQLIKSPSLDRLSEEGRNCGEGAVFFTKYENASYAVEVFYGQLAAYRIDRDFNLQAVCKLPNNSASK
jgi:hypothetical protein